MVASRVVLVVSPAWAAIDPRQYGLSESSPDNSAALQRAFDEAQRTGQSVDIPEGTYSYRQQLRMDGITVSGAGERTVLLAQVPTQQRILMTGQGPVLENLRIGYRPLVRSGSDHGRKGVMVQDATDFRVEGVTFDGEAFGAPEGRIGGGALFIYRSDGGVIRNNHLIYTAADAIHMTGPSRNIEVVGNLVENAGDDGIAVVNYQAEADNNITIHGNMVLENRWGRGIAMVGAREVHVYDNFISGNSPDGAGIYVASEPAYQTAAPRNLLIEDNMVQDTGGPGKGHGQIMLWSGNGPISDVTIRNNDVLGSKRRDLAIVLSGSMRNVTLTGNNVDGNITRRNGGGFSGSGNATGTGRMPVQPPEILDSPEIPDLTNPEKIPVPEGLPEIDVAPEFSQGAPPPQMRVPEIPSPVIPELDTRVNTGGENPEFSIISRGGSEIRGESPESPIISRHRSGIPSVPIAPQSSTRFDLRNLPF